jgi:hypothetical protein
MEYGLDAVADRLGGMKTIDFFDQHAHVFVAAPGIRWKPRIHSHEGR